MARRQEVKGYDDPLAPTVERWVEHELRLLYRQSNMAFEEPGWKWYLDRNLEKIGAKNPWKPIDPEPSSNGTIRPTSPRPHTNLDEFGHVFRKQELEVQGLVIVSHFNGMGMELLQELKILHSEESWLCWMTYYNRLSKDKRELSKITAVCWLVLNLAWSRNRRGTVPRRAY